MVRNNFTRSLNCLITFVIASLVHSPIAVAENHAPDGWTGFGCFYDETFGSTVVYARCDWITFSYTYSGFEPAMPPPGWIQIDLALRGKYSGADEIEVEIDGHRAFQVAGYPYFGVTQAQLDSLLVSKSAFIEARWWTL